MSPTAETDRRVPLTRKGMATRQRIVDAACDLVYGQGVARTTLDDVMLATGTSKSQLYHYFRDKSELIRAVVSRQWERVLGMQRAALGEVDGWAALERWKEMVVSMVARAGCRGGCPIGSLASELSDLDDATRARLDSVFRMWEGLLASALAAMVASGSLRSDADTATLALATMASVEGGLLLAKTARSTRPLEVALDAAIGYLRSFAPPSRDGA